MMDALAEATMAKGEFAAHIGVSAARISQYIASGQIGPEAIEGQGPRARIRVGLAVRHIAARRDAGQAMGNGLSTRLDLAAPLPAPLEHAPAARVGGVEEQIKLEKLRAVQIANRKAAEEEEFRVGRFTETAAVREQMARLAGEMLQTVEGMLPALATAIAARFSVPQRDVLHLLRHEFREHRAGVTRRHGDRVGQLPETVEMVVEAKADAA